MKIKNLVYNIFLFTLCTIAMYYSITKIIEINKTGIFQHLDFFIRKLLILLLSLVGFIVVFLKKKW